MTRLRRTQAERRAATRAAVLESAGRLFGSKGYPQTSIEEIAAASGLTIRPIYHYFGNERALFEAVNELMEERIVASIHDASNAEAGGSRTHTAWRAFLELCSDPELRQIVLIDAPVVLGRDRWAESPVTRAASGLLRGGSVGKSRATGDLATRMRMAALAETALCIPESDDPEQLSREEDRIVTPLLAAFRNEGES